MDALAPRNTAISATLRRGTLCLCALLLGACSQRAYTPKQGLVLAQDCIIAVQAPGAYVISPGRVSETPEGALPRARADTERGGTAAGAAAINRCIAGRALG